MKTLDLSAGPVPIHEWDWVRNNMALQYLTCKNHTDLRWLTKHPGLRTLHYVGRRDDATGHSEFVPECPCPLKDLQVIRKAGSK